MRCADCRAENPGRAKFCMECGTKLPEGCVSCGEELIAGAKFCIGCGAQVETLSEPVQAEIPSAEPAQDVAERRQLTVLFSDLVGSTTVSELMDPEDYRELIAQYRTVVTEIVETYGGRISNFVGDGVVALFGYPVAHEGGTFAAALAALDIVERAPSVGAQHPNPSITTRVRVGLHTGPVVVSENASGTVTEQMALYGDTPNVAARIQSFAKPGQVVVSAVTRRLIGTQLEFDSAGTPDLAGVSAPIELYSVRRPASGLDGARRDFGRDGTPLIGRSAEIALVENRWDAANENDGQVLVITGEAGIGKSRIVFALGQGIVSDGMRQLTLYGSSLYKNSAFHPVKAALSELIDLPVGSAPAEQRARIETFVEGLGMDPATAAPIARLMGITDALDAAAPASPDREKSLIIDALLQILSGLERDRPLLLVMEDAHWIDPTTLELVSRWIDGLSGRRCLVLITARPEFVPQWRNLAHVTSLELNRFGRRDTIRLIESIAGARPHDLLLDQIVARTDGVPLFIEELTKMLIEAGIFGEGGDFTGELSHAIPESLQDSLMARLDRLSSAKETAQVAAAIGRTFSGAVLSRVRRRSQEEVAAALDQLVDADLIVPVHTPGEEQLYRFRHALVQEAAYQSMLRAARARWHGRIAKVLETELPGAAPSEAEIIGYHYQRAGDVAAAERCWVESARMALSRSANVEAITHLEAALECLRQTPPGEARDRREMDLQIMIAVPLAFVKGYAHESVLAAYDRARALCRQYGEVERLFKVIYGQFRSEMLGGRYGGLIEQAEMLSSLSKELGQPLTEAITERSFGSVLTYLGRPEEALTHLHAGTAVKITRKDRLRGLDFDVVDLAVAMRGYLGLSGWLSGDTAGARQAIDEALTLSQETDHPFSVCFALAFGSWVQQFTGDEEAVRASSARLIALSQENSFQFWLGWGRVMNGWARRAELGPKALEMIEQGLEEWRGTGSELGLSYFLGLHADVALSLGKADLAERLLDEAAAFEDRSGEAFWHIGLARLRGNVALVRGDHPTAEARLREAVAAARRMGHRGPLLRAATELARLARSAQAQVDAGAALRDLLRALPEDDPGAAAARQALHALPDI
ncbi:adenylate/guanylate cyclase domain-containing protein [Halovulum sp. GXIMD14794]